MACREAESHTILPVARLLRHSGGYEFAYIRAVDDARDHGFEPLLSYPDLGEVYFSQELPPLFKNRVIPNGRPERPAYLKELGFEDAVAEPITVLARSGGRRATDRLEVFAPPVQADSGFEGCFLARGVRYVPGGEDAIASLEKGERLFVMADLQNAFNPAALALRNERKQMLAYVPDYLACEIRSLQLSASQLIVNVDRVNLPPSPVHHRLLCRFSCPKEMGELLFRGDPFQPLSASATPFAA